MLLQVSHGAGSGFCCWTLPARFWPAPAHAYPPYVGCLAMLLCVCRGCREQGAELTTSHGYSVTLTIAGTFAGAVAGESSRGLTTCSQLAKAATHPAGCKKLNLLRMIAVPEFDVSTDVKACWRRWTLCYQQAEAACVTLVVGVIATTCCGFAGAGPMELAG
ncbi:hypothetical protein COO60DRAFT_1032251 [Scenedesmus sp. NREL 46B-D3]|nr:hypothetical protein COO60DRAFT_1032251 [Scenedesmus sp. NREL 46B-D3]